MALGQLRLDDTLLEHGLERWYATAVLGEVALIEIPRSGCVVELRRLLGARVLWHVQGGRSLTMPFAEALQRLAMLRPSPPSGRPARPESPQPGSLPTG